jgi:hypothetical protein
MICKEFKERSYSCKEACNNYNSNNNKKTLEQVSKQWLEGDAIMTHASQQTHTTMQHQNASSYYD